MVSDIRYVFKPFLHPSYVLRSLLFETGWCLPTYSRLSVCVMRLFFFSRFWVCAIEREKVVIGDQYGLNVSWSIGVGDVLCV